MIRRLEQIETTFKEKHMGGEGIMEIRPLLQNDEFSGKGRVYGYNILKPGCAVGVHAHTGDFEVYHILKGEGTYHDNGKDLPVKAGDIAYAWDGDTHGLKNTGTEDLVFTALILFTK